MHRAIFVSRSGKEITLPLVRSHNKLFLELPNGVFVDFADEIQVPVYGNAVWIETIPPDPTIRPHSTQKVRDLARVGL